MVCPAHEGDVAVRLPLKESLMIKGFGVHTQRLVYTNMH